MKIGIIGAGHIGGALTRRFTAVGHEVAVANSRGPATLAALAGETGAGAVTVSEAVRDRDLIVITIPVRNIPKLPAGLLANTPPSVPVIDTGNYYPRQRDGHIAEIENGVTESRWAAKVLGHTVIKVFNNINWRDIETRGVPKGAAGRIALPVAGDDAKAKAIVMKLVEQIGFDAVDAGDLDESWRQQPGTPAYGTNLDAKRLREALTDAQADRPHDFRGVAA